MLYPLLCNEYPTPQTSPDPTAAASFSPLSLVPTFGDGARRHVCPSQCSVSVRRTLPATLVVPTAQTSFDESGATWLRIEAPPRQNPRAGATVQPVQGPSSADGEGFGTGLAGPS